jgi:hypothetical protein
VQPGRVREIKEGSDITPALERPPAGRELVEVPRQLHVDAGVPRGPDLVEPRPPLLPGQPEVEEGRTQHEPRFVVDADVPGIQFH